MFAKTMPMTTTDLKALPGFIAWADEGETRGFLRALAECIDDEIGNAGGWNQTPHEANINLGVQITLRQIVKLLRDPLRRSNPVGSAPVKRYGPVGPPEESEWK